MTEQQIDDLFDIFGIANLDYDEEEQALILAKEK